MVSEFRSKSASLLGFRWCHISVSLAFDLSVANDAAASVDTYLLQHVPDSNTRPVFKVSLPQPRRFDTIDADSDVALWLRGVGKICRLAGYAVQG